MFTKTLLCAPLPSLPLTSRPVVAAAAEPLAAVAATAAAPDIVVVSVVLVGEPSITHLLTVVIS